MVKETWRSHPELCKKALQSFFELLQGLDPERLEQEPEEVIGALNQLLLDMVNEQVTVDNQTANEIASLAVSCLVALVLSRGEPHRMLCAISAIITGDEGLVDQNLQIPENMNTLQRVVQATLLNSTPFVDWYGDGVMTSFQTDRFTAKGTTSGSSGRYVTTHPHMYTHTHTHNTRTITYTPNEATSKKPLMPPNVLW